MAPAEAERRLFQLLCQGDLESALADLRCDGATPIASIMAVSAVAGVNVVEATRIIVESETWSDHRAARAQLLDDALKNTVRRPDGIGAKPLATLPVPTADEERQLQIMINMWDTKTVFQRAVCTAMMRGHDTPESVGYYFRVSADDVRQSLNGLWGVLYDRSKNRLWFK